MRTPEGIYKISLSYLQYLMSIVEKSRKSNLSKELKIALETAYKFKESYEKDKKGMDAIYFSKAVCKYYNEIRKNGLQAKKPEKFERWLRGF